MKLIKQERLLAEKYLNFSLPEEAAREKKEKGNLIWPGDLRRLLEMRENLRKLPWTSDAAIFFENGYMVPTGSSWEITDEVIMTNVEKAQNATQAKDEL